MPLSRRPTPTLITRDAEAINCVPVPATPPGPVFPDASPNEYALGSRVQVTLRCKFRLLTPFINGFVGDLNGDVAVGAAAEFAIRGGTVDALPVSVAVPTPTPTPTATPDADAHSDADSDAQGPPTPTPPPATAAFYGTPTSLNSQGGGPPGSIGENQTVRNPGFDDRVHQYIDGLVDILRLDVRRWWNGEQLRQRRDAQLRNPRDVQRHPDGQRDFGRDANRLCARRLSGPGLPWRPYVNSPDTTWTGAGFTLANLTEAESPRGRELHRSTSNLLTSGQLNPPGGCSGATITVGP